MLLVADIQQYGTCSPACMYKFFLTSFFICMMMQQCKPMQMCLTGDWGILLAWLSTDRRGTVAEQRR